LTAAYYTTKTQRGNFLRRFWGTITFRNQQYPRAGRKSTHHRFDPFSKPATSSKHRHLPAGGNPASRLDAFTFSRESGLVLPQPNL